MTSPSALRATATIHVFPERVDELSATLAVVLGDLAVEVAATENTGYWIGPADRRRSLKDLVATLLITASELIAARR